MPFSKGIHDYYAHYSDNADAKIGALLGINLAVAGLLIGSDPSTCAGDAMRWIGVALNAGGISAALLGLYPRGGTSGEGPIFWEHVRQRSSGEEYARQTSELSDDDIERAYAENNYAVANVLHTKFACVRAALFVTAAALPFAGLSVIFS